MPDLKFKTQRGFQIDPTLTKPINKALQIANQLKVTAELAPFLDKINASGGYILVTIQQDGETFENQLAGCDEDLFSSVIDNLSSK